MFELNDADFWVCHLIFPIYFTGKALNPKRWQRLFKEPLEPRSWCLEISGRSWNHLSNEAAIASYALEICERIKAEKPRSEASYRGYMKANAADIKSLKDYSTYLEPVEGDVAHSNLVKFSPLLLIEGGAVDVAQFRALERIMAFVYP